MVVGPDLTQNGGFDVFVARDWMRYLTLPLWKRTTSTAGSSEEAPTTSESTVEMRRAGMSQMDATGAAYISGMTKSSEATFPDGDGFGALPGTDRTHNGKYDAFVAKVRPDGAALVYAGYIGGRGDDFGFGMAVDAEGSAYITGNTTSTEATFPVRVGPDLTYNQGVDGFVAKLNPSGDTLVYLGYIGGKGLDQGLGVTLDDSGRLYVAGHTLSDETSFPVVAGPDLTFNGSRNKGDTLFISTVSLTGLQLEQSGYIGGKGQDAAFWVAVNHEGDVYVVGDTESSELSFPDGDSFGTLTGIDQVYNGGSDAFITKLSG